MIFDTVCRWLLRPLCWMGKHDVHYFIQATSFVGDGGREKMKEAEREPWRYKGPSRYECDRCKKVFETLPPGDLWRKVIE